MGPTDDSFKSSFNLENMVLSEGLSIFPTDRWILTMGSPFICTEQSLLGLL